MNNLSEEIIAKFLMGKCTEEELVQVNLWIKESDENARKLFRMEEIYHLGKEWTRRKGVCTNVWP